MLFELILNNKTICSNFPLKLRIILARGLLE